MKGFVGVAMTGLVLFTAGSAFSAVLQFQSDMMKVQNEVPLPANAGISVATGTCTATLDDVTGAVTFSGHFESLNAPATNAHIHAGAVGMGGPVRVNKSTLTAAVTGDFSGSTNPALPAGSVDGPFTPTEIAAMKTGGFYCNVHDSPNFPGGEIRGQLNVVAAAPAMPPWAVTMLGLGLVSGASFFLSRRRRLT
jgi:hypothetical protein